MSETTSDKVKKAGGAKVGSSLPHSPPGLKKAPVVTKNAVPLDKDSVNFGLSAPLTEKAKMILAETDFGSHEEMWAMITGSEHSAKDLRSSLVGNLSKLVDLNKELHSQSYEGRTLHSYYKALLDEVVQRVSLYQKFLRENSDEDFRNHFKMMRESQQEDDDKIEPLSKEETAKDKADSKKLSSPKNGEKDKGKEDKKPSFAKATADSEKPVESILTWADMVEEELGSIITDEVNKSESLVSVIRNKSGLSTENRVLIPGNLETSMPKLFGRLKTACALSGSTLVRDPQVNVTLARPVVWGDDYATRDAFLGTLYDEKGNPKKELGEIADLAALIENMLELPSVESLKATGPGRTGLWHSVNLISRIYCEQVYDTPIAKQRNWWKVGEQIRSNMRSSISNQVGGEAAANLILNASDVLYRKFIRRVLNSNNKDYSSKLTQLVSSYSAVLFNKGGALFTNLLRTETKVRKVEKVLSGKKGKDQKVTVDEKYVVRVRPKIADGPRTAFESSVYAKVNVALSKIESRAEDYSLSSQKYSSPNEWEKSHKSWVENLYQMTKIPSHLMVQRKQNIRATIMAQTVKAAGEPGKVSATENTKPRLTQAQWISSETALMQENEDKFDLEAVRALNSMMGSSYSKDELMKLSEDSIMDIFSDY